mgnify:CR=1 FL=1
MPSPTPLEYGTYYHIYNRGNNREDIFIESRNYLHFLRLYERHISPVVETYAYCLLKNHFHFLVRIKDEETLETLKVSTPSQHFSNFFNAYTKAMNKAYGRTGSLFQHPFRRIIVQDEAHLLRLVTYIHQNPQKHRFVEDFRVWKYSSYHACISDNPTQVQCDTVLAWFGGKAGFIAAHQVKVDEEALPVYDLKDTPRP